jgi:hypothetical protein
MAAGKRLTKLREKKRAADNGGPPLTRAEEVSLRFLGLLYPPPRRSIDEGIVAEHPFWNLPAEVEHPRERGPVCADLEDFEEFADVPPFVIGNPNYPPEERGPFFVDLEDFEEFVDVPPFVSGNPNYPPEERGADFSDSTENPENHPQKERR